jgi:phosphoglycerol transferase MdoB-like AlkP superfamily enzyme
MKKRFSNLSIFFIAVILLWIKTYIVYKLNFHFELANGMEQFILFFNPLSSVLLFLGIGLLFPKNLRNFGIIFMSLLLSFVLLANVVYYREFTDFITIPLLFQKSNMEDLGSSINELFSPYDAFMFLDNIVLIVLLIVKRNKMVEIKKRNISFVFILAIGAFYVNLLLAETQRTELLTRAFDREMLVKYIGTYNYHIYDIFLQTKTSARKTLAKKQDLSDAEKYVFANKKAPNSNFTGIAKGKNVIVISLESLQNFVVNKRIDGQEITPFLNSLINNNEAFYFDNLYHQVGQGKTSDAEFMIDNSLYPLPRGAVFFTQPENEFIPTEEILKKEGYYSSIFHANNKSFWNRNVIYKNFGVDDFHSLTSYSVNENNSVGWGLMDTPFFQQSMPYLKSQKQPFYSRFITLTNHFPFSLRKSDELIPEWTSKDGTVNRYFTTVRYLDESLKVFFDELKKSGLYDNSVIVMYGDHYGLSENHNDAMAKVMGQEITPFESAQLQRVPVFIHVPGVKGQVIHTVSGQVDIRPTILNLLGVDTSKEISFGSDLFSKNDQSVTVFRDGSFVSKDFIFTQEQCYSKEFGQSVSSSLCEPFKKYAQDQLKYSDQIIYGDLLRFTKTNKNTKKESASSNE